MKLQLLVTAILAPIFLSQCANQDQKQQRTAAISYPITRKVDTVDTYFGVKVPDPYRWLEDDNSDSTKKWVDAQNAVTFDYLNTIPFRNKIKDRLKQIWNFEKQSAPYLKGKRYFFSKNDGMQNQSVLYYKEGVNAEPQLLMDPNQLSKDGTVSLSGWEISPDGKYMAYGISKGGSDWVEWFVRDIENGKDLTDHIEWNKFSGVAWDNNGFYYGRYEKPSGSALSDANQNQKLYYHKLGTTQDQDVLIYADDKNPLRSYSPQISDDKKWLIVYTSESTSGNGLMFRPLSGTSPFTVVISEHKDDYGVLDIIDDKMIIRTNNEAPNFKLVEVDVKNIAKTNWKTIIPESKNMMSGISMAGNAYIVHYLVDVKSQLMMYDKTGKELGSLPTPEMCSVSELSADRKDSLVFIGLSTFTAPPSIVKYNMETKQTSPYFTPKIDFKSDEFETKQVFYPSKDGTKIPMFITHKKGIKLDGNNPTFIFGYGGFSSHYAPEFRLDRAVFLEAGGIYCVANIRGGDEYGEAWHQQGIKCKKQNVFDDFIAAGEYLIKEKYTSSEKLAVQGRSNGGLLIGAVMTQRPDLFKVCIPMVGVLDMLRYHQFTIGRYWSSDYGLSENEDEFKCLYKYSPLHNVRKAAYPATLITTGDHDDRVVPAHSFKFAATLQENHTGTNPVLIRIDKNAGHGAGKPTDKQIEEFADIWAFTFYNLGMTY
ncbi:MAG: prolyl oligopeptidase family serine peptidase [Bacteroidetes bacterium]|nr:prolyl oligopeptidase family serine peptidase [Bacteroidota bacterium]